MPISNFSDKLFCHHCGKNNLATEWPTNGDNVPFYYQEKPGKYNVTINCPHCNKKWYVVWDQNPGKNDKLRTNFWSKLFGQ